MDFCPHCKTLMKLKEGETKCPSCGFLKGADIQSEEKVEHNKKGKGVVDDKNLRATYEHICKKCGYEKAEVIDMGTWISDEDTVFLMKCGKCGYSENIAKKPM